VGDDLLADGEGGLDLGHGRRVVGDVGEAGELGEVAEAGAIRTLGFSIYALCTAYIGSLPQRSRQPFSVNAT
jgi:hypothetical protein